MPIKFDYFSNKLTVVNEAGGGSAGEPTHVLWSGTTADDTPTELFVGGVASERYVVGADTCINFELIIAITDTTADAGSTLSIKGGIMRDGADNTALQAPNPVIVWSSNGIGPPLDCVDVAADDANEALIITVTGHATNTLTWKIQSNLT